MKRLEEYATLLVEVGLNVKPGENVMITSQIEDPRLAKLVAKKSYEKGAREVMIRWADDEMTKLTYLNASEDVFDEFQQWKVELFDYLNGYSTNYLNIISSGPEALKGVSPERLMKDAKNSNQALKSHIAKVMGSEQSWCVAAIPGLEWARKVFPDLSDEEAIERMWDAILNIARVEEGKSVDNWRNHTAEMSKRNSFMNESNFKTLHFTSANGTDLKVGLVKDHIWAGGSELNPIANKEFVANIPTEECFTMPDCNNVDGIVYSTKPLSVHGNLVDKFWLKFEKGKVVDFDAEVGLDVLKQLLDSDEGAKRIGEVALVPYDSPISNTNILFFNTLFDENASCHLALGRAYSSNIKNYHDYSKEELEEIGVNDSVIHVDFMIGDKDTQIVGETYDGNSVVVFKDGNFAI